MKNVLENATSIKDDTKSEGTIHIKRKHIFRLFRPPSPYLRKHVFSTESTLGCQIDKYTRLFGTKET